MTAQPSPAGSRPLREVAGLMLRLGLTAFGGPAAHIAMMHDETVKRRKWINEQHFLDLLGATNLIPGPNSTEMAIHLGYVRAGWWGLLVGGAAFILPAMLIVIGLAHVYVVYGTTPAVEGLLVGIKPVVVAIVLKAIWGLGRQAIRGPLTALAGLAALGLFFLNLDNALLMIGGGVLVMLIVNGRRLARREDSTGGSGLAVLAPLAGPGVVLAAAAAAAARPFTLSLLFFTFLKIGSVLYGSGYTLLAFLEADFVQRFGWLTTQQIIDAVAIGQVTPGPVFTTATFIGYLLGGLPGALLATLGIFLPSFVFVALSSPFIPRLRRSPWAAGFLDGVNAASLGLMAAVTLRLAATAFVDPLTIGIGLAAALLVLRTNINSTWLMLGAGSLGAGAVLLGLA